MGYVGVVLAFGTDDRTRYERVAPINIKFKIAALSSARDQLVRSRWNSATRKFPSTLIKERRAYARRLFGRLKC